ncbi:MAG: hypothetical protein QXX32_02090 [Thermofilum sp.]|jgi:uncharacterized protein YutE (UPF0331/DUF86 family)|uniref:Uncharacterized protein n=2 Tax=Thermofilum adornatum TaxID=1365176 RepID=S5ZWE6_9CREN|nr:MULTISPECIES: hypothetical protein [Thermofilum]AGT35484.1 hypothetical protein N186_05715 [Thermofilum adornatum]AJB41281.1 hypothetical protein TCARB_0205 [Thermofilum adornatum 1505]MCC5998184.1 hypothetical protein [Thermofilum sp.]MCI4409071.1 hypothetical protein [Thermofilum sp.]
MSSEKELKYKDLSDEEVEELIQKRLREIKNVLTEIKEILQEAGVK